MALAILSVSALLIFQFVGQQFAITSRVERMTSGALGRAVERERFTAIVKGLTPGWPNQPDQVFTGTPARFTGLTGGQIESVTPGLYLATLQIVAAPTGTASQLVYRTADADFVIARFSVPASFSYLAPNGAWIDDWPPPRMPDAGQFDDTGMYRDVRPLPQAIRIRIGGGAGPAPELDWIAQVDWRAKQLPRRQDQEVN